MNLFIIYIFRGIIKKGKILIVVNVILGVCLVKIKILIVLNVNQVHKDL